MSRSVHELVFSSAASFPQRESLSFGDQRLTYAELTEQIVTVGQSFGFLGLHPPDRVAVFLPKQIETVSALFGASAVGAVFVPLNPVLKRAQIAYILRDSGARVLVTSASRYQMLEDHDILESALKHVILVGGGEESAKVVEGGPRIIGWSAFLELDQADIFDITGGRGEKLAALFYTSGSTGQPKGVAVTHDNLVIGARSVADYLVNSPDDRLLAVPPLSFDYGFSQLTTAFAAGAAVRLMNYLLPRDIPKAVAANKITGLACVPPAWHQLAELEWPAEAVEGLRYITSTGGRMPHPLVMRLKEKLPNTDIFLMYGLTEAFRSTYLPPHLIEDKPNSIGKAIPNAEIRVMRPDGSECDADEVGELVHMGPLVSKGYWNDPERTAYRFRPAPGADANDHDAELAVWSGDLVTRDAEGFIYFVGRNDDMIKSSGYRISPTELEEVVHRSGLVSECAAIGVEDDKLGQVIVIAVTPKDGAGSFDEQGLRNFCMAGLPNYMQPRAILAFDSLPRNPNGKVDRGKVGELVRQQVLGGK